MSMTNYLEAKLLDHSVGTAAYTMPTDVFMKLHVGDAGEDGTANPAAHTARVQADFDPAAPDAGNGNAMTASLSAPITFSGMTADEAITHFSLWDAAGAAAGNPLWKGALTSTKNVEVGDDLVLDGADLTLD